MCRYIWWTTGRKGNDSVFQHNNCLILAHQPWKTDTRKKWRNPGQQLAQWMTSRHHFPNTNSYSSLATFRTENWSYIAREKICRSHNSKRYETCTEACGSAVLAEFSCLCILVPKSQCHPAVLYLFIRLAGCSINPEINHDVYKLTQILGLKKKDMIHRKSHKTQSLDILDHIHGMLV